ncbi:MAG: RNA polymerase factor sigma-54, partial [Thiohalocapsa sp.]
MKQTIQIRLGQQLTMTPQLQQAIKLLQLSTLDLQREIQDALESNLMLENADEADSTATTEVDDQLMRQRADEARLDAEVRADDRDMPSDLPTDSDWADTFDTGNIGLLGSSVRTDGGADYDLFATQSRPQTLHDHLAWQLNLARLGHRDMAIAEALIDAIDADGYLRLDLDDLPGIVGDDSLEADEAATVLHRIQSFDPSGVGARDLRECLMLQLRQLGANTPGRDDALKICDHYFNALGRNDLDDLRRRTRLGDDDLRVALSLIRSMSPRPGAAVAEVRTEYVVPDVLVRKIGGVWQAELNPETTPSLRVNASYAKLIRRSDQ